MGGRLVHAGAHEALPRPGVCVEGVDGVDEGATVVRPASDEVADLVWDASVEGNGHLGGSRGTRGW